MSAAPTSSVASPPSDPDRSASDRAAPAPLPRVGSLLRAVRLLVDYGTALIATLQQRACLERCTMAMMDFGTRDLALIIARIKCGLQRAAALEERLNGLVARGVDLPMPPVRPLAERSSATRAAGKRKTAAERAALLAILPSAEEIAEKVRTQSLGVVIADICRELGLMAGTMDTRIWDALSDAALDGGFDLCRLIRAELPPPCFDPKVDQELTMLIWSKPADQTAAINRFATDRIATIGAARGGDTVQAEVRPP